MEIIYEDENVKVIDKAAGINSDDFEKRVHRLDKDTSGILLIAKNDQSLDFLQKQFKERKAKKKYIALVVGNLKEKTGEIKTLLGRSPNDRRKQKVYFPLGPDSEGKREALTKYRVIQSFKDNSSTKQQNYDLIEAEPLSGRKHQIRTHLAYLGHPIAGDKLYCFKNQPFPARLKRQFLHANYLKINLPNNQLKEFFSELPEELKEILKNLK